MSPDESHLTDEQLAALIDGQVNPDEEKFVTEHLAQCRFCMTAYSDTVRQLTDWKREKAAPDSLEQSRRSFLTGRMLAAACLPLLVAFTAWLVLRGPPEWTPTYGQAPEPILGLLVKNSARGMILPGAENAVYVPPAVIRSGGNGNPGEDSVLVLIDEAKTAGLDPVFEIGAYLAENNNDLARLELDRAQKAEDPDPAYQVLRGIQLWTDSEISSRNAEEVFRSALEITPRDPVARFNLAFLLAEQNQLAEAIPMFEELAEESDHRFVAGRARDELAKRQAARP